MEHGRYNFQDPRDLVVYSPTARKATQTAPFLSTLQSLDEISVPSPPKNPDPPTFFTPYTNSKIRKFVKEV